ncbi:MAP kinase-interacting serine/threonine-protein kinase 2 [Seminavis robusta]|uniref:MAP kinase-interacting serine/threonine-protein kinase 2 n=1 Tax=Seminavis robusta TaxID=568900 RepID=A0A9N8F2W2_9STRA|nr:MAP kinase-interacting serine/threonine-protein kinase 2 [Seminavis robusta]|eukprot:Sro2923_g340330.1 MAP kinase-interacting serine/threonine-protein kinase 2 (558) ;mRNA; r:7091-8764
MNLLLDVLQKNLSGCPLTQDKTLTLLLDSAYDGEATDADKENNPFFLTLGDGSSAVLRKIEASSDECDLVIEDAAGVHGVRDERHSKCASIRVSLLRGTSDSPIADRLTLEGLWRSYWQDKERDDEFQNLRVAFEEQGIVLERTQVALQHERAANLFLNQDLSHERAQRQELERKLHEAQEELRRTQHSLQAKKEPLWPHIGPVDHDLQEQSDRIGDYSLGKMLGEGFFGQVRLGVRPKKPTDTATTNRSVAIKIQQKKRLEDPAEWAQLDLEVGILQNHGHHPNIIGLLDVLHAPEHIYLVMERGALDLHTLVHESNIREVQPDWMQQVMIGILEPLQYLHARGIAHLDLKPENCLILTSALDMSAGYPCLKPGQRIESSQIRLCDFGLAAVSKNYNGTDTTTICDDNSVEVIENRSDDGLDAKHDVLVIDQLCGTPGFFAPEMILRGGFEGRTADMWSVGCLLLEISFGYPRLWMESYDNYNQDVQKFEQGLHLCLEEIQLFYDIEEDEEFIIHDFLTRYLLQMNMDKRATAAKALKHPWFEFRRSCLGENRALC